jgi:hypothetical protein
MMDWLHFAEWLFYGVLSGAALYGVHVLGKLQESVELLNVRIAVIVEKVTSHEKILDRHETSIADLKAKT